MKHRCQVRSPIVPRVSQLHLPQVEPVEPKAEASKIPEVPEVVRDTQVTWGYLVVISWWSQMFVWLNFRWCLFHILRSRWRWLNRPKRDLLPQVIKVVGKVWWRTFLLHYTKWWVICQSFFLKPEKLVNVIWSKLVGVDIENCLIFIHPLHQFTLSVAVRVIFLGLRPQAVPCTCCLWLQASSEIPGNLQSWSEMTLCGVPGTPKGWKFCVSGWFKLLLPWAPHSGVTLLVETPGEWR